MCGIVGYIGNREAFPVVIKGLKRLEYRGYDSAGIMTYNGSTFEVCKTKGKVADLEDKAANGFETTGSIGIGHTRWATHGIPNDVNSHPHVSNSGDLVIIHNGIIENYAPLKEELIKRGYSFKSDTDTEVLINLIEEIQIRCELDERVLVTTLTKRMAEELAKYLKTVGHEVFPVLTMTNTPIHASNNFNDFRDIQLSNESLENMETTLRCDDKSINKNMPTNPENLRDPEVPTMGEGKQPKKVNKKTKRKK